MGLSCKYWKRRLCPSKTSQISCYATLEHYTKMHTHAYMFTSAFMCLFFEVAIREQKPHFIHSRSAGDTKHAHLSRATGHWICQRSCHNHIKGTHSCTHTHMHTIHKDRLQRWYKRIFDLLIMQSDERAPQHGPTRGQASCGELHLPPTNPAIPLCFASLRQFK